MKNKIMLASAFLLLTACGNADLEEKNSEQEKTISSLTKEVETLKETVESYSANQETMPKTKEGEAVTLSGTITIGEDLAPGVYDITLPDSKDVAFSLYKDDKAKENDEYTHEWLFPKKESDNKKEDDSLIGYSLKEGNILKLSNNLSFTKVR